MKSGRESENFRKIFHVEQLFRIWRQNSQYRKNIQIVPEKPKNPAGNGEFTAHRRYWRYFCST